MKFKETCSKLITKIKSIKGNTWLFATEIMVFLLVSLIYSLYQGRLVDFHPINGTFQNYNPIRRLFSGNIVYKDFQDYLGLGHLYTGAIFTLLFGLNYRASLIAFQFITCLGVGLTVFLLAYAIFRRKTVAMPVATVALCWFIVQPLLFDTSGTAFYDIFKNFNAALYAPNSARFIRGMCLSLGILSLFIAEAIYKKIASKHPINPKYVPFIFGAGMGAIAAGSFIWSNDYGVCCWLCIALLTFWIWLSRKRDVKWSFIVTGVELLASFVFIVLFVTILTLGHFGGWVKATFGTGGYQGWYYNSQKTFYLWDADLSWLVLAQFAIAIIYFALLFIKKGSKDALIRYGVPGYANLVCFVAVNEYKILSGGTLREVAFIVLGVTIILEIFAFFATLIKEKSGRKIVIVASYAFASCVIISFIKELFVFKYEFTTPYIEVEELGGRNTHLGNDLYEADTFLNGATAWSTYATAQEVVSDYFQPSGTDYIIHVLGDKQREKYLEQFKTMNFQYTATQRESYTYWESWAIRANWFWYRELYENWHPIWGNNYELYWERNTNGENNSITSGYTISVVDVNETTKKLIIQCDTSVNGMADVYLDYEVNKTKGFASLMTTQTLVRVENTGTDYLPSGNNQEDFNLRSKNAEYMPISVVNGYGEVTLTSMPTSNTTLTINKATCDRILTAYSDYLEVDTLSDQGYKVAIKKDARNSNCVQGATKIAVGQYEYNVTGVYDYYNWIIIQCDEMVYMDFTQRNHIQIIR